MSVFDVIIIGGGASGSVCAYLLARGGKNVCVVDTNTTLAKKLLVTGNGRCNLTNKNLDSSFYNQNIDIFLSRFNQQNSIDFFNSLGVEIYADSEGRCYPVSNTAKSVVFALQKNCDKVGVKFFGDEIVIEVEKNDNYIVKTQNQNFHAKNIVFACGYNNNIDSIIKKFDIKTKNYVPSLVALKTRQSTNRLDGLRISDVKVTAKTNGYQKSQMGEVLFKKDGLSGICIFNLSAMFARNAFDGTISIDILPSLTKEQIVKILNRNKNIFDNATEMLSVLMHKELGIEVLRQSNILQDTSNTSLTNEQISIIAHTIKNLHFDIVGHYQNNQVYSGGVELSALTNNLQSKNHNGMYFCGEICDVDGECGGYNLQWAFTSAFVVAQELLNTI